jgi:protein O-GlcNAc transferase
VRNVKKIGVLLLVVLALGCGRDAEQYMEEGNAYLRRGEMANAVSMFEKAVEADPGNYEAHNSLGVVLSAIGDFERAIGHFQNAVALNDSFVEGHYNLGRAYAEVGRFDDALAELRRTIDLDSTYALAYLSSGDIFAAMRMSDQSEDAYLGAIRFDPNLMSAYIRLSSMYVATGQYDEAIALLLRARELRPRNVDIVSMAGRAAIMKRDFPQAADLLADAVRLDSTDLLLRNDLATALMLSQRKDEAAREWRKVLAGNPGPDLERTVLENLRRAESDTTG